jgi:hypothetical protein
MTSYAWYLVRRLVMVLALAGLWYVVAGVTLPVWAGYTLATVALVSTAALFAPKDRASY